MRLVNALIAVLALLLAADPLRAGARGQVFDDPSDSWDLETYRQTRDAEDPTGAILPVPDPAVPYGALTLRRARLGLDAAGTDAEPPMEEAGGIRLRDGPRGRLEAAGVWPLFSMLRLELAGRARIGAGSASGGDWLERSLRWSGERFEIGIGLTQMAWGDADEGSLLLGRTAPPRETIWVRSVRPWRIPGAGSLGRIHASFFLSYLDERDRTIPYPLLHGQRLEWEPSGWFRASFARTILLGGAGRTEKFQPEDIWDVLLGRGENVKGHREPTDTDQKASFGVELRLPREQASRIRLDGARIFYEYAGEDAFDGLLPTAVAHAMGAGVGIGGWTALGEYLEAVDDANPWYTHTIYGPDAYCYRGYPMGHPMGGGGRSWHLRLTSPELGENRARIWGRVRGSGYEDGSEARSRIESVGALLRRSHSPAIAFELSSELYRESGAMRPRLDPPVRWQAGFALRYGATGRWDP